MDQLCPHCNCNIPASNFIIHEVKCSRDSRACPYCQVVFHSSKLNEHKKISHVFLEQCLDCKEYILKSEHQCQKALTPCDYCNKSYPNSQKTYHEQDCGVSSITCSKCNVIMTRIEYLSHLKIVDCRLNAQQNIEGLTNADIKYIFQGDFSQLKLGILGRNLKNKMLYLKRILEIVSKKSGTDVTDLIHDEAVIASLDMFGHKTFDEFLETPEIILLILNPKIQLVYKYAMSSKDVILKLFQNLPYAKENATRTLNDYNILNQRKHQIIIKEKGPGSSQVRADRGKFVEEQQKKIDANKPKLDKRDEGEKKETEYEEELKKIVLGPNPLKKLKKQFGPEIDKKEFKEIKLEKNTMERQLYIKNLFGDDELMHLKFIKLGKNPLKKFKTNQ